MGEDDKEDLIGPAKEGDRAAFGQLYSHYKGFVTAFVSRKLGDDLRDWVQDWARRSF